MKEPWTRVSLVIVLGILMTSCAPAAPISTPAKATPAAVAPAKEGAATPAVAPSKDGAVTPTAKPSGESPKAGGILTRTNWIDPPTMDLHQEISMAALVPLSPIYNNLIQFDPREHDKIIPALAEKWEANDKGDVYTFFIRKGVKWHDGKPLTAEDIAFSLMRMSHPKDFGIVAPRGITLVGAIKKAEAIDDTRVRVELSYAQASFLEFAANDWVKMMPRHTIQANQGDMKRVANGTGPFKLKEFTRGVFVHLVKNPDYWVSGRPYLDEIKMYAIPDDTTRFVALRTNKVLTTTLSSRSIAPEQAQWTSQNMADKITIGTHKSTSQWNLEFNHTRAPWNDVRVRQAVNLAISRKNLQDLLKGYSDIGDVHYADGPWGIPSRELLQKPGWRDPKDTDIAEAKRLLTEAGHAQGIKTTLLVREGSNYADFAQALQGDLGKVGIQVTIEQRMTPEVEERARKGNFDLHISLWTHNLDDPATIYRGIYLCDKSRVTTGFCDQQVDQWFMEQETTLDKTRRREIVRKMADKITAEVAAVNLVWQGYIYAHWKPVKNWVPGPGPAHNNIMQDVWLDR